MDTFLERQNSRRFLQKREISRRAFPVPAPTRAVRLSPQALGSRGCLCGHTPREDAAWRVGHSAAEDRMQPRDTGAPCPRLVHPLSPAGGPGQGNTSLKKTAGHLQMVL